MSKDKYPNIPSPPMEAIFFVILQIFLATRAVLKIGGYLGVFVKCGPDGGGWRIEKVWMTKCG